MKYKAYHFSYIHLEIEDTISPKKYSDLMGIKAEMEENLERVRIKEYPNYNTRLNCVFLAPTEESAKEWCREINIWRWRDEQKEISFYLYVVELSERPIWYNAGILLDFNNVNADKYAISKTYWDSGTVEVEQNANSMLEFMSTNEVVIISKTKWKITTDGEIIEDR